MMDAKAYIKDNIKMSDLIKRYTNEEGSRIHCPLHSGNDLNFVYREKEWHCYSQCGHGDVISFVQILFGLSFANALKKIDEDFCLGIYGEKTIDDKIKIKRAEIARMVKEAKLQAKLNELDRIEKALTETFRTYRNVLSNEEFYQDANGNETELHKDARRMIASIEAELENIITRRKELKACGFGEKD